MKQAGLITRPWGLSALFAALVLAGLLCWPGLPTGLLPRLPHPTLTVITNYENASPQEVEDLLTRKLESVLGTVAGVVRIESSSSEGRSSIKLVFAWGRGMSEAAAEVREKLDSVADQMPRDSEPPLVLHFDPSQSPVVTLGLSGGKDMLAARTLANTRIKAKLEALAGVAAVRLSGGLVSEIQVLAERARLVAFNIDLARVVESIKNANLNSPAGDIRLGKIEVPVRTVGRFSQAAQIGETPLKEDQGSVVLVRDLARTASTHKDRTGFCRLDGREAVLISILKEPQANSVEVSQRVRKAVAELSRSLPSPWKLSLAQDQAPFISDSLSGLGNMVLIGAGLAFLALLIYLARPGRAALVVLSAPLALFSTFGLMRLSGVGLNLMSIGGLALGVGMLVDGSIVVMEAYQRHREQTPDPAEAARMALREVRGGLICGALTTAAVLSPLLFLTGLVQRLFMDFAFTLVVSLGFSLAVALLLLPALLVWLDRGKARPGKNGLLGSMGGRYGRFLDWCLKRAWLLMIVFIAAALLAGYLAWQGFSLLPSLDDGRVFARLTLPQGSEITTLESVVARAEERLQKLPGVKGIISQAGRDPEEDLLPGSSQARDNQALLTVLFGHGAKQSATSRLAEVRQALVGLEGAETQVALAGDRLLTGGSQFSAPALLVLSGDKQAGLQQLSRKLIPSLDQVAGLSGLQAQGAETTRQMNLSLDREKAALHGISLSKVASEVSRAVQGEKAGKLLQGDLATDIRVRLTAADRDNPRELGLLPVMAPGGAVLRLSQLAKLNQAQGPLELLRRERRPAVVIRAQVKGSFSQVQDQALKLARPQVASPQVRVLPGPDREELNSSFKVLGVALSAALLLIYVILVLRFESLRWPLVIILSLPPVALGPALALKLAGLELSTLVLLGAVVLLGVAVNGAILLVELANRLVQQGLAPRQAVVQAARIRLSPLLLSVSTTVLGALPLCLGWGGGAAISRPLALTVVSGLIASLACTLLLTPALYLLFHPAKARRAQS